MSKYKVEDIRNIALAGHGASGKTSLADALLFQAKAVDRKGSVDDGTSVSDFDEEEHKRHFSIDTSRPALRVQGQARSPARHPRLSRLRRRRSGALSAVETAVIVVSAINGVEVNTRRMFSEAGRRGLARMFVINKIDGENVKFMDAAQDHPRDVRQGLRAVQRPDQPRPQACAASSAC